MARRIIIRLVIYLLLLFGGIVLIQDRQLYFPDILPQPNLLAEAQRDGLLAWPATGELRGLRREPAGHARATLLDRYDSLVHLATAQLAVAVVVAERDSIVPARYGENLYESLRAPKRLWQLSGAGHNDWMDHLPLGWWDDAMAFMLRRRLPSRYHEV